MGKKVILWGGTGHGKMLLEEITTLGHQLVAVFDNNPDLEPPFEDVPLYHGEDGYRSWRKDEPEGASHAVVAVAGAQGRDRLRIQQWLQAEGLEPLTLVNPGSHIGRDVVLGAGVQVLAGCSICAETRLGDAVIVNSGVVISHECVIGDGAHVSAGAVVAGHGAVGANTFVGVGALVLPRVRVGDDVVVGAGAVVTRDVPDGSVVYGSPARVQGMVSDRDWTI